MPTKLWFFWQKKTWHHFFIFCNDFNVFFIIIGILYVILNILYVILNKKKLQKNPSFFSLIFFFCSSLITITSDSDELQLVSQVGEGWAGQLGQWARSGHLFVWVFICLGVRLFGCSFVWVFVYLGVRLFGCLFVWVFVCLGVPLFGCSFVWVFVCLAVSLFGCSFVWMFVCLGVCLFGW